MLKLNNPEYVPGQVLADGSIYVGFIDGYHLSIEPKDEPNEMTWHEATKLKGCPTVRELKLISANYQTLSSMLRSGVYWSSTEYGNNYAWYERFSDGYQSYNGKNTTYLVRCVRRYYVNDNNHELLLEIKQLKTKISEIEERLKK